MGCCDLVVWVRFCWINGGLCEDLGLGVVGCCNWVCGGLLRLGIVIGSAMEEEIWVLVVKVYGVDC